MVEARAVIVCVSTAVLAAGALRILPELPAKLTAAEGLPLGLADRVFLKLDEPEAFAVESMVCARPSAPRPDPTTCGPWAGRSSRPSSAGPTPAPWRPRSRRVGGVRDRGAGRRLRLRPARPGVGAGQDAGRPILGREAPIPIALPGRAGERAVLAAPVDGRLFFAGEACSPHAFSTAHGAWETASARRGGAGGAALVPPRGRQPKTVGD